MGVAYVGLVHCDPCECKVKDFYAVPSMRGMYQRGTCKGCNISSTIDIFEDIGTIMHVAVNDRVVFASRRSLITRDFVCRHHISFSTSCGMHMNFDQNQGKRP